MDSTRRIEIRRQVEPAIVRRSARDESAPALLGFQQVLGAQEFDRLANRHPRHAKFLFQLLDGRDFLAFRPVPGIDALTHHRGDLKIKRHAAAVVDRGKFPHRLSYDRQDNHSSSRPPTTRTMELRRQAQARPKSLPKKRLALPNSNPAINDPRRVRGPRAALSRCSRRKDAPRDFVRRRPSSGSPDLALSSCG